MALQSVSTLFCLHFAATRSTEAARTKERGYSRLMSPVRSGTVGKGQNSGQRQIGTIRWGRSENKQLQVGAERRHQHSERRVRSSRRWRCCLLVSRSSETINTRGRTVIIASVWFCRKNVCERGFLVYIKIYTCIYIKVQYFLSPLGLVW